jgi:hypothetical protein
MSVFSTLFHFVTHRATEFCFVCFILSAMDGKIELHVCIGFHVKLGELAIRTLELLCVTSAEHCLSWTVVFEWHSCFTARQVSGEDDE